MEQGGEITTIPIVIRFKDSHSFQESLSRTLFYDLIWS